MNSKIAILLLLRIELRRAIKSEIESLAAGGAFGHPRETNSDGLTMYFINSVLEIREIYEVAGGAISIMEISGLVSELRP